MNLSDGYAQVLEQRFVDFPAQRKSERTRAALLLATAKLLEEIGYKDLRVAEIAAKAGVGTATFHDYFSNRNQAAKEVLSDFVEALSSNMRTPHGYSDVFAGIYFGNKRLFDIFQANPGIMRGMFQLADQDPEFAQVWRETSMKWYQKVTKTMLDRHNVKLDQSLLFLTVYTLGGMIDEFMRGLYVHRDSSALTAIDIRNMDSEAIVYFLTMIWYRSIFGKDPDAVPVEIKPETIALFDKKLGMHVTCR